MSGSERGARGRCLPEPCHNGLPVVKLVVTQGTDPGGDQIAVRGTMSVTSAQFLRLHYNSGQLVHYLLTRVTGTPAPIKPPACDLQVQKKWVPNPSRLVNGTATPSQHLRFRRGVSSKRGEWIKQCCQAQPRKGQTALLAGGAAD